MSGSHIFISYSHQDERYVRELARRLREAGHDPWYFSESQPSGVNWAQRLLDVVSQARAVIVVISAASNSPAAEYVLAEVMLAQRERRFIIPLKIAPGGGPLDIVLAARNWVNAWDGADPLPRLLAALATQLAPPPQPDDIAQLSVAAEFRPHVSPHSFSLEPPGPAAFLEQGQPSILCRLGRDPRGDIVAARALAFVSRQHARIAVRSQAGAAAFLLADEQSSHGTFVNGARITGPHELLDGDEIGLGTPRRMLVFSRLEPTGAPGEGWAEPAP